MNAFDHYLPHNILLHKYALNDRGIQRIYTKQVAFKLLYIKKKN